MIRVRQFQRRVPSLRCRRFACGSRGHPYGPFMGCSVGRGPRAQNPSRARADENGPCGACVLDPLWTRYGAPVLRFLVRGSARSPNRRRQSKKRTRSARTGLVDQSFLRPEARGSWVCVCVCVYCRVRMRVVDRVHVHNTYQLLRPGSGPGPGRKVGSRVPDSEESGYCTTLPLDPLWSSYSTHTHTNIYCPYPTHTHSVPI